MATPDSNRDANATCRAQFRTTRWSLILAARDRAGAGEALEELCETYWYPLYAFLRRKGHGTEEAEDLVQGFFVRFLEKNDLNHVAPGLGKFRSFLMAACSHYVANRSDHDRALKRGGRRTPFSIDWLKARGRFDLEPAHTLTPERLYERQWAITLLDCILNRLKTSMASEGKSRLFDAFSPALLGSAERVPYAKIATSLGISEDAARAAAQRLRRRYRKLLREEVGRTLDDPAGVDEEIRDLFRSLCD